MSKDTSKVVKGAEMTDDQIKALWAATDGERIAIERLVWKAENGFPLFGKLINHIDIPLSDRNDNPNWRVFLVMLTKPTKGTDRDGNVVFAEAGRAVIVTASAQIEDILMRYATDTKMVHEIGLMPKKKTSIAGGKTMWTFEDIKHLGGEPRTAAYALSPVVGPQFLGTGVTSSGELYDSRTGELVSHAVS